MLSPGSRYIPSGETFTFHIVTLGCPKNIVDSQQMERLLCDAGGHLVGSPREAQVIIVNTCGFIEGAKRESINTIISVSKDISFGQLIVGAGCLTERYGQQLLSEMPELAAALGTRRWADIVSVVEAARSGERVCWIGDPVSKETPHTRRPGAPSAYLKIADGCNASCTFCAIPAIKGPLRSRPMDSCVTEAQQLVAQGARELVLIAQDTTAYGYDLGESEGLSNLIDALVSEVPGHPWIRVMYTYPQRVTQRLISKIARHPQVQKYLDLPLQHNDPDILTRMGRPPQGGADLVHNLRKRIPDIAIRTSFIVGFPGETEKEHQDMLRFMEEMAFDWAGVFMYSREEGTPAAKLPGQVPGRVKRRRYQQAMEVQQEVTRKRNAAQLGRTLPVLVESVPHRLRATGRKHSMHKLAEFRAAGRSYREAPEVDGMVLIKQIVEPGIIVPVTITDSFVYDLGGEADLTGEV